MDRLRTLLRGRGVGGGLAFPTLGALLLLVVSGGAARLLARGEEGEESPRCGREHPGRGESAPLDLGALERSYAAMKRDLALKLGQVAVDPERAMQKSIDLGLPSCRGRAERRVRLQAAIPVVCRRNALRFLRAGSGIPAADAEILLVSADGWGSVAELSRALGKRVTLAPPRLVQVLGLRCAPTRVTFTEDGDEAILEEGE